MKKQSYIYKLLWLLPLVALMACSDDFLEKAPNDALDPSKIDASKAEELRNAIYAEIPGSDLVYQEGYADNGYSRNWWDSNGALIQTNAVSGSENFGYGEWNHYGDKGNSFGSIRTCNMLLAKLSDFDIDEDQANKLGAEARMLRAWLYMELTLYYGDVTIVERIDELYPDGVERNSASEVRNWILSELDEAASVLPVTNDKGKFNKAMAYALKARAAYYFGNYAAAEEAARYVIDKGGYSLYYAGSLSTEEQKDADFFAGLVDFADLGIDETAFIEGIFNYRNIWNVDYNSEVIVSKEYVATEDHGDFNRITSFLSPNLSEKQAWATIAPIQDLVDDYWLADGESTPAVPDKDTRADYYNGLRDEISTIQAGPDGDPSNPEDNLTFSEAVATIADELKSKPYMAEFLNRDSRLYASIVFPFSSVNTYFDGHYQEYNYSINNYGQTGFVWRKMSGGDDLVSVWGDSYHLSGADFPVIRLAEMLLIYAEAHTQTTGYDGTVTTELNKLRDRCGMPNVPNGLGKQQALDFIRRERRIELAGEGHRYFDIRLYEDGSRNGGYKGQQAASAVMQGQTYDPQGNPSALKVWDPRLMLMPIPTTSMDKNPLLKQNEGY
ncbi:RagB/SusD family nutrient uptake outer membrane protein [Carboxylicivirga sediminis]|uniref:RagB/SusD family nutrient uptake outer membrane protein n=1 Tax=Carboxylicivirga sediminis TaxID=2006564 RepID=A0A941FCI6_9BACT|nr:RagB/SusD family nutrient uptake outer membrane protein [Carboxylicivirga sediminis]MBR8538309.1 RagB/SusD family nutrient uptake outer membrane protein [Carboxylicivirga sediminis]